MEDILLVLKNFGYYLQLIAHQQVRECVHDYGATSPIDGEHWQRIIS